MKNNIIKDSFIRISPTVWAEKFDFPLGWFVINYKLFDGKIERRKAHGKWYKIKSEKGQVIYRILRFSTNLSVVNDNNKIVLDWMGWIDLNGRDGDEKSPLGLEISKAKFHELIYCGLSHPDPAFRLSTLLGIISVSVSIISLIIAFVL